MLGKRGAGEQGRRGQVPGTGLRLWEGLSLAASVGGALPRSVGDHRCFPAWPWSGRGWEPASSEQGSRGADGEPGHEGHCGPGLWTSTGSPTGTQGIKGLGLEWRGTGT